MPIIEKNGKRIYVPPQTGSSSVKPATTKGSTRTSTRTKKKSGTDINDIEQLKALAEKEGVKTKENKTISALKTVGGILNIGAAATAGALRGALRPKITVKQGIKEGIKNRETFGFGDVLREDLGVRPKTLPGKVIAGGTGLAADILLDPTTYITLGSSALAKVAGKGATKTGLSLSNKASREIIQATGKKQVGVVNELFQKAASKKGLQETDFKKFIDKGIQPSTLQEVRVNAQNLFDKGGIRFAGKTIASKEAIQRSPIGKALSAITQTARVQNAKQVFGKAFIPDFGKNKKLVEIMDQSKIATARGIQKVIKRNEELFKGFTPQESEEFFTTVFNKKKEILDGSRTEAKAKQQTERLVFNNPKLQKVADELFEGTDKKQAIVKRLARLAEIPEEEAIKFYIPSIFRDKIKPGQFEPKGGFGSPALDFQKQFKGVETLDLIRNPQEAFTRGQVNVLKARTRTDAIRSMVKTVGKDFSVFPNEKAARINGFELFERNGVSGKIKGWVPQGMKEQINELFDERLSIGDELAQVSGFDYATGLFKSYVTSLFPSFHIRNMTSNQFNNALRIGGDVLSPQMQANGLRLATGKGLETKIVLDNGEVKTLNQIRKEIERYTDIFDEGAFGKTELFIKESLTPSKIRLNPLSPQNVLLTKARKLGGAAENWAKSVAILSEIKKGKSVQEAIKTAEEALFNYGKLSTFERSVLRRLIPFYTFARKNAELQLKTLARTPGKTAAQLKLFGNAQDMFGTQPSQEEQENLPDYIKQSLGIRLGESATGQPIYLTGFGLPIEEFMGRFSGSKGVVWNAINDILIKSNPLVKYPMEKLTGYDVFRQRRIEDIANADEFTSLFEALPQNVSNELKQFINYREAKVPDYDNGKKVGTRVRATADSEKLHFFRNLPTARLQSTWKMLTSPKETTGTKTTRLISGARVVPVDIEEQKFFKELNKLQSLQKYLKTLDILGEKNIFFQKKTIE